MTATLPGMPMRYGDAGLFICGPDDIAPWERDIPRRMPQPAALDRAPRRTWLVLAICLICNDRTGVYCRDHGPENWWLTHWGRGGKR